MVQNEAHDWVSPSDTAVRVEGVPPLPQQAAITTVRIPRSAAAKDFLESLQIDLLDAKKAAELVIEAFDGLDEDDVDAASTLLRYLHRLWSGHRRMMREVDDPGRTMVPCHSATGLTIEWRPASTAYYSSTWIDSSVPEQLYGGLKQREFLASEPIPGEQPERAFFDWLGVASEPRATRSQEDCVHPRSLAHRPWMRDCGLAAANPCEGHPETYRKVTTPWLDRLDVLISGSASRRRILAGYLGEHPELLGPSTVTCTSSQHSGTKAVGSAEGQVARLVLSQNWLPARLPDGSDADLRPSECWTDLPVNGDHFALPTVDLSSGVGTFLGCGSGRHAQIPPLLAGLERLQREWPELAKAPSEVVETADWLFGRLHPALKGSAVQPSEIPVPAWSANGRVWSHQPLVADVDGIEALEDLEWIPRGTDFRTYETLGLRFASEVITSTPVPVGKVVRDDVLTAVNRCALYALLQKDSADVGRLGSRLAKLEQVSVPNLDVELEHRGKKVRSSQPMLLETIFDKVGRLNGGKLYLRHDWQQSVPAVAGRLVGYLDEPEMTDRVAHFLSAPEAVMDMYDIDGVALTEAEAALKKYRRLPKHNPQPTIDDPDAGGTDGEESAGEEEQSSTGTGASGSTTSRGRSTSSGGGTSGGGSRGRTSSGSSAGGRGERPATKRPKTRQKQSRLITYVAPGGEEAERQDPQITASRTASDTKGVEAVLEYERKAGRFPKPMDHGNKGYDIESYATAAMTGAVERYIEVKSLKHEWGPAGVKLSRAQFDFGRGEFSDRAWLYVVEHAQSKDPKVHALPRVARRADGFYFDHGWRAFAEDPSVSSEQVIEEQLEYFQTDVKPLLAELLRRGAPVPETLEGPSPALPGLPSDSIVEAAWLEERAAIVLGEDHTRDAKLDELQWRYWPLEACTVDQVAQALGLDDQSD